MGALIRHYNNWAETLEFNRLLVMAVIILIHTCVVVPPTLLLMLHGDAGAVPYLIMTIFSFMILVSNLAVMPTRITISIFGLSTLAHIMIVIYYLVKLG